MQCPGNWKKENGNDSRVSKTTAEVFCLRAADHHDLTSEITALKAKICQPDAAKPTFVFASEPAVETWRVPADMGRRYARVSGDWNPHHLWLATARPLGYKRPIAHGMWTMAKALGGLESRDESFHPKAIETWFKRPIFMPGTAILHASADGTAFEVWDEAGKAPHARGRVE